LFALLVSVSVAVFLLWGGCETRKFYRYSLRPFVSVSFYFSRDGAGWTMTRGGVGPSILKSFVVKVDDKEKYSWDEVSKSLGLSDDYTYLNPTLDLTYLPGFVNDIFWFKSKNDMTKLSLNHNRVTIELCYCSFYDECWSFSNKHKNKEVNECPKVTREFGAVSGNLLNNP
jgi:hypothetical protein